MFQLRFRAATVSFLVFVAVLLLYTGMLPATGEQHGLTYNALQVTDMDGLALYRNGRLPKSRFVYSPLETVSPKAASVTATMATD